MFFLNHFDNASMEKTAFLNSQHTSYRTLFVIPNSFSGFSKLKDWMNEQWICYLMKVHRGWSRVAPGLNQSTQSRARSWNAEGCCSKIRQKKCLDDAFMTHLLYPCWLQNEKKKCVFVQLGMSNQKCNISELVEQRIVLGYNNPQSFEM